MSTQDSAKQRALDLALKQIEKNYGKGAIMRLGDSPTERIASISSGSLLLDSALGIGGRSAWTYRRDLRSRIIWKDHIGHAYHCGSSESGRGLRIH